MASEQASRLAITRSGEPGVVPLRDHVLGEFQGGNAEWRNAPGVRGYQVIGALDVSFCWRNRRNRLWLCRARLVPFGVRLARRERTGFEVGRESAVHAFIAVQRRAVGGPSQLGRKHRVLADSEDNGQLRRSPRRG